MMLYYDPKILEDKYLQSWVFELCLWVFNHRIALLFAAIPLIVRSSSAASRSGA